MDPEQRRRALKAALESKINSGQLDLDQVVDDALMEARPQLQLVATNRRQAERKVAALRLD
mgnify:CR=1 FL=1